LGVLDYYRSFWRRQSKNWKVLLTRDIINSLTGHLTERYGTIYLNKLGAGALEIGFLNSISSFVRMFLSIPSGLLVDRIKRLKRLFVFMRIFELPISLISATARDWRVFIYTNIYGQSLMQIENPAMNIISIECIKHEDRVTGMTLQHTLSSAVGLGTPMLAAFLIASFGGMENADSYRPLYIIQFFVGLATFLLLAWKLEEPDIKRDKYESGIISSLFSIFKAVPGLKRVLLMNILQGLLIGMRTPLVPLYLYSVKHADVYLIALQGTLTTAVNLALSVPMGRLADKVGRRKVAYFSQLSYAACVIVAVMTPETNPEYLLIYTFLSALGGTLNFGWNAFLAEYIPLEGRGRWMGVSSLVGSLVSIPAPIIGGLIWNINPDYLWWIGAFYYTVLAIPLMMSVPELPKSQTEQ